MTETKNLKFVISGHVDHGKSTLIGRLLYDTHSILPDKYEEMKKASKSLGKEAEFAYILDQLEEERQQGITIDTTQVFFKTDKREYVIIDAPGHVEFVKNMITGASQAEAAIVIIDAKEGIKEQTKRHAYIVALLGLHQVIVAVNKMDLIGYKEEKFRAVTQEFEKFLMSISIKPIYYIPICALEGDNIAKKSDRMGWYTGPVLLDVLDTLKNRVSTGDELLLFPVQDVYKFDDKRIIVGRIESGCLKKGDTIQVLPSHERTQVQSIEKYPGEVSEARAGESIGITTKESLFISRGDVICEVRREPTLTSVFKANIFWMAKEDLTKDERIVIRCATQETTCKVEAIKRRINTSTLEVIEKDAGVLKNLEVGEIVLRTKKPIAIKAFNDVQELGRFVLVKDNNTCAGGIIIDETT